MEQEQDLTSPAIDHREREVELSQTAEQEDNMSAPEPAETESWSFDPGICG